MIQTMQSELFRIRKSRLFWVCLVLAAFFVFALALTFYHNSVNGMLPVISLVSFTEFLFSDYSLIFPLTLFLCLYFTEDFHTGTYSITLSKGTSRVHLFFVQSRSYLIADGLSGGQILRLAIWISMQKSTIRLP